jgi:hypothetical protein
MRGQLKIKGVELPSHSGNLVSLKVADELRKRLTGIFVIRSEGQRLVKDSRIYSTTINTLKTLYCFMNVFMVIIPKV